MDLQLVGKTALVTGASMGIGRAIAKGLAAEGVQVAAVARRTHLLDELASEIERGQGSRPRLITQDIMAADAASRLCDAALSGLGHIDILVNCAGGSRPLPLDAPEERWEEAITLNFTRQRQITHALLPQMIERGWGRIINITGKSEPDRLNAAFSAKAAVHEWAKGLSRDVGGYGSPSTRFPRADHERADPPQLSRRFIARATPRPRSRSVPTASPKIWLCWPSSWPRRSPITSAAPLSLSMAGYGAMLFEAIRPALKARGGSRARSPAASRP